MLKIKERQIKLSFLGYYKGAIDGIEGKLTKEAYLKLQKDYFVNNRWRKDIDGIYGINTDRLLCNVYIVKSLCTHFGVKEFKCKCGNHFCSGYPAYLNENLLLNLENMRRFLNSPIYIESGIRCSTHNRNVGGSDKSRHKYGKAIDIYSAGFKNIAKRKEVIDKWLTYKNSRYGYGNGYSNLGGQIGHPSASKMGHSVHLDVK